MTAQVRRIIHFVREHNLTVLVILFVLSVLGALLFALLAEEVMDSEFQSLNTLALGWFNSERSIAVTDAVIRITNLGSVFGVGFFAAIAASCFVILKRYDLLKTLGAVLAGGSLLGWLLKLLFHIDRPSLYSHLVAAQGFSFPSGHSTGSFCFWGYLALLVVESRKAILPKTVAVLALLVVPVSIALSRMYLQVHFLTDVTAGALLAIFWVTVCEGVRLMHQRKWRIRLEKALG